MNGHGRESVDAEKKAPEEFEFVSKCATIFGLLRSFFFVLFIATSNDDDDFSKGLLRYRPTSLFESSLSTVFQHVRVCSSSVDHLDDEVFCAESF